MTRFRYKRCWPDDLVVKVDYRPDNGNDKPQAIDQVLSKEFEPMFCTHSYGFIAGRFAAH